MGFTYLSSGIARPSLSNIELAFLSMAIVSLPLAVPKVLKNTRTVSSPPARSDAMLSFTPSVFFTDLMLALSMLPPLRLKVSIKLSVVTGKVCSSFPYTPVLKVTSTKLQSSEVFSEIIFGKG